MTLPPESRPFTFSRRPASIHLAQAVGVMQLFGVIGVYSIYQWFRGIIGLLGIGEITRSPEGWLEGVLDGFLFRVVSFVALMVLLAPFAMMIAGIGDGGKLSRRLMIISQSVVGVSALAATVVVRNAYFTAVAVSAVTIPSLVIVLALNTWSAKQWVRQGGMRPWHEHFHSRRRRR